MRHFDATARKRPVNLTLNEDLVARARQLTNNLSGVVETLLADYVEQSVEARQQRQYAVRDAIAAWNAHGEKHGSIADEYSPL
jgi:antitoxin CcdA